MTEKWSDLKNIESQITQVLTEKQGVPTWEQHLKLTRVLTTLRVETHEGPMEKSKEIEQ